MTLRVVRWGAQVAVVALAGLAFSTCQLADILRAPGAKNVTLVYLGDSTLVQGRVVAAVAEATADGAALPGARFAYASSDTTVVAVGAGDSLRPLKRGTTTLTVSLTGAILPSTPPAISRTLRVVAGSIVVDSARVTFLSLGDTATLHATALDANGNAIPGAASWRSTDTSVISVSAAGKLLALKNGTATVHAILDLDSASVAVTVRQALVRFSFDQASLLFDAIGATATVAPTARDARGNVIAGLSPAWSSGDTTVALVNAAGTATSVRVGSTFLRARLDAVSDSLAVTVAQRATRIVIGPRPVPDITSVNGQRQLSAVAYDRLNVLIPSPPFAWTVTDPAILSVSAQGLVTGLAMGTAKVAAALGAGADSVTVSVTNAPVSLRVTPHAASSTSTGDTLAFSAAAFNARGDTVPAVAFSWRTPDTAIVQVTQDGHAIFNGVGTARVIAVTGSLADTATVTATNLPTILHFKLPSGVTLGPLERSLTAPGDVDTTPVVIQNARNADLSRGAATWSVDDPNIVRVTALGIVTARDTGRTLVRITANGLADSASYTVTNVPASIVIDGLALDTLTALGQALPLVAVVTNHRGAPIAGYSVAWRSSNALVADSVVRDSVRAKGFGSAVLIATAGSTADTFTLVVRRLSLWTVDNASVVSSRVGSVLRPFAKIQDAVDVAGARDTVVVRRGVGAYSETVALSRSLTLLGDSAAFVSGGRVDPGLLPMIAHDSGAAGIAAITSAPMTIRYLAMRHSLDGPAVDANGSGMRIEYFYVNPPGSVPSRIGRGISIRNSASGTSIARSEVDSVQGYGIRLETVAGATVNGVVVRGVDSLPGIEEGAGIKVLASAAAVIRSSVIRGTQVGVLVGGVSSNVRVDSNDVTASTTGMRIDGGSLAVGSSADNDIYGNDSAGVVNPLIASLNFPGNWWGDGLGPRSSGTPSAAGDSAVGPVTYAAVRTTPLYTGTTPAALVIVRGNNQSAAANNTLPLALAVRVVDANGFPVPGVSVTFSITAGGRSLGGGGNNLTQDVTADAGGLAQTTLRLGQNPGQNTVTVTGKTVAIGSVTFTETGQ